MRLLLVDTNSVRLSEQAKATALAACGAQVTLLAPIRFQENYQQVRAQRPASPPYRLVLGPMLGKPPNRCFFMGSLREAFRPRPDAVLVLADENFWLTGQCLAARNLWARRALFVCHSWRNVHFNRRFFPQPHRILYEMDTWLERRVFKGCSAIVLRNREAEAVLRRRGYRGPAVYIPWAVDTHSFRPRDSPEKRPYTIGFVGRFVAWKGVEDLLAASRLMQAPHRLLLVGGGPEEGRLRAQADKLGQDRVEFHPTVAHEKLPSLYGRMDVLVLPSRTLGTDKEQFGRVLAEAMSCRVAVAGSDSGGIPDVIGKAGRVFPEGDARALAGVLDELAEPALRMGLAAAGEGRARQEFSWAAWALRTIKLMEDLSAGRRPGPPLEVI